MSTRTRIATLLAGAVAAYVVALLLTTDIARSPFGLAPERVAGELFGAVIAGAIAGTLIIFAIEAALDRGQRDK